MPWLWRQDGHRTEVDRICAHLYPSLLRSVTGSETFQTVASHHRVLSTWCARRGERVIALQRKFAARVAEMRALEQVQTESHRRLDALFASLLERAFKGEL